MRGKANAPALCSWRTHTISLSLIGTISCLLHRLALFAHSCQTGSPIARNEVGSRVAVVATVRPSHALKMQQPFPQYSFEHQSSARHSLASRKLEGKKRFRLKKQFSSHFDVTSVAILPGCWMRKVRAEDGWTFRASACTLRRC